MLPADVAAILLPLVRRFEGCRLTAYRDPNGIWTIGWGHTGAEVQEVLQWTQEQADAALQTDLAVHFQQLLSVSPKLADASASRQAALTSFVYNLGIGVYEHSTLRSAVDCWAWISVKTQLAKWVHAGGKVEPGLVARRGCEIALIDS